MARIDRLHGFLRAWSKQINNSRRNLYIATDLNNHSGNRTVEKGSQIIVQLATLPQTDQTVDSSTMPVQWHGKYEPW
jgi:hypothetical protein